MTKKKVVPSKEELQKLMDYKFPQEQEVSINLADEVEDLFDALRSQEEKLEKIYDLESSLNTIAVAVAAIASDFADSNEELFRKVRQLKAMTSSSTEF
jgi:hypothetical protein